MRETKYMIQAENLSREFNGRPAVRDLVFAVKEGEVFGFLGPNGAGKTTTINMLIGQLRPTFGRAWVAGFDIATQLDRITSLIGVVFEEPTLYEGMSGQDNLAFFCELQGASKSRVSELLAQVGLTGRAREKVKTYSQGMKQRLTIARALINHPRVLFLDEPTRSLDPATARAIRRQIAALSQSGTTIFLTTHHMEVADQLCHRVAFINKGRIVACDSPEALKIKMGRPLLRVVLKDGSEHMLNIQTPDDAARLQAFIAAGQILTLHSQEASLEDVYLQLTGQRLIATPD
ncbi:MAG: ABC transporter [Anaerolineaceae bacterium 4572_32.1]|nr:MAG: ABC transporter [Anaerolineaceae bacterium 4572_32.1]